MVQEVCQHHEWIEAGYKDTAGNSSTITQCRKCGHLFDQITVCIPDIALPSPAPSPVEQEAKEKARVCVEKFYNQIMDDCDYPAEHAKQCALICVASILKELHELNEELAENANYDIDPLIQEYMKIQDEITNL